MENTRDRETSQEAAVARVRVHDKGWRVERFQKCFQGKLAQPVDGVDGVDGAGEGERGREGGGGDMKQEEREERV